MITIRRVSGPARIGYGMDQKRSGVDDRDMSGD